jgi:NAD(P) transhydrogenase subunit alpha
MEFLYLLIILVLSCFVGFYVIWNVTPALHSPLMSITNAISSIIVVGAIIGAGINELNLSSSMAFIALILAFINIFGGFIITYRMLSMFKKKIKK